MNKITQLAIVILLAVIAVVLVLQYQEDRSKGPVEKAAEQIDKAIDKSRDALEN